MVLGVMLVLLAIVPLLIWTEDVSWCIDEPRLIASAWHANNDGHLAAHGLYGNFGVCYGPVPTQIYQVLLSITHDPATLIALRALLTAAITGGSLLWLGRALNLPIWFAAAVLIAPQIANHHRVLWDASFTIPIGTLALAAFANFIRARGRWPLRIALAAALELPLIHPQSLPLAVPILGYLFWKHRSDLWADRRGILWTLAVLFVLNAKYFVIATFNVLYRLTHGTSSYPGTGSRWVSALAPFFGGNLLNGYDYVHTMARPAGPDWLVTLASWCARLVYPLIWVGIGSAVWRIPRALRAIRSQSATVLDIVVFVAVAGLVLQSLIFIAGRIPLGPQYFFGTFALHAFFAWVGVEMLRRIRLGTFAGAAFGLSCAYVTLGIGHSMHHEGHEAGGWPTMRNAVALTRSLNEYSDTAAYTDIPFFKTYPQPLRTTRLLIPPKAGQAQKKGGNLLLTYAEKDGVRTGRMIVKELGDAQPPAGSVSMDITPLPRDWVPDPATWFPDQTRQVSDEIKSR
jgi:hypothetical protein